MINTHQELVIALSEAAELEHNLICQYLFAAYSLKTDAATDNVSPEEAVLFGSWRESVLTVARQEMGHLGTIWNLAAVVGALANNYRANFPQAASGYYPPKIGFLLQPFNAETLSRFIDFERPEPQALEIMADIAPDPLSYTRVGDLYRQIRHCVATMSEKDLLINSGTLEDTTSWSNNVTLKSASTRNEMLSAIDFIIVEGEGSPGTASASHFSMFSEMLAQLKSHLQSGGIDPAMPTVGNPSTQVHRGASGSIQIDHAATVRCVDLFNLLYGTLLHLLRQFYAFAGETEDQRVFLRNAAYQVMHGCMGQLGPSLSRMPAWQDGRAGTAGPSFELYGHETLITSPKIAWDILARRMRSAEAEANELATLVSEFNGVLKKTAQTSARVADLLEQGLSI